MTEETREIIGTDSEGNDVHIGDTIRVIEHESLKEGGAGRLLQVTSNITTQEMGMDNFLSFVMMGFDPENAVLVTDLSAGQENTLFPAELGLVERNAVPE